MTGGEHVLEEDDFIQMSTSQLAEGLLEAVRGVDGPKSDDFMQGVIAGLSLMIEPPKDRLAALPPVQLENIRGFGREAVVRTVDAWDVSRHDLFVEEKN